MATPIPFEDPLRDSESRLRQVVDNASNAIFIKDLDGRFLFVNREFERMKDVRVGDIVGKLDRDVFPEEADERRQNDRRVVAERRALDFEERVETAHGTRTYLSHKFPLLDGRGEPYAVCGIAYDITRRKEVESALRAAALAVSSDEGANVFAQLARYLAEILGVDATLIAVFVDGDPSRMRSLAAHLSGRALANFEYPLEGSPCRHVVGRAFRFVGSGVHPEFPPGTLFAEKGMDSYAALPLNDSAGRPLGLIAAMDRRPMTDAHLAEAMLKIFALRVVSEIERTRTETRLRASEASYRAIFEASEDAIFVHDWDTGRIVDVNPKACATYGFTPEEFRTVSLDRLSSGVPPYTTRDGLRWIERAKAGESVRFEWHRRNRDGSLHWDEVDLKAAHIAGIPRVLAFTRDITERKLAEEALRAREEQYRAIFDGSADALVLWNRDIRIVDVNVAYTQMYGDTREDAIGATFSERIPKESVARRIAMIRRALVGQKGQLEEIAFRVNGDTFLAELRYLPILYRGEPHVLATIRDITERKRAEAALRASEAQYRSIFEAATDALQLIDVRHVVVDVNPAYERMYGRRREDVVGKGLEELLTPAFRAERMALVSQALAGEIAELQSTGFRQDGQAFDLEVRCIPFEHRGERHVLGIARDITSRKRAEAALRDSEEQYRAIFNASADALVLRDASFRIVDVNATYEAMSGYRRESVLGVDHVIANPPEFAPTIRALHERALAGERIELETTLVRSDGRRYDLELRGVPILHRGAPHVLYMGRDVTARKSAERQQQELESQLRQAQKMEAIGQLTGGIAHDFNNILTSVLGYTVLALERAEAAGDTTQVRYLQQTQRASQRARDLIQQMLTFSRGRRGAPRPLAWAPLVRESLALLRSTLPATIELESQLTDAVAQVRADPVQLEQVLLNLCINARDAIDGTGRIRVGLAGRASAGEVCASCRCAVHGPHVELSVADTGSGIAPAVLDRMFEPFYSTKEVGKGSGMGLSTVHGIVHEHHGHVLVDSAVGRGATFRVLLPALAEDNATAAREAEAAPRAPGRRRLAGHVLVVDDEAMVADYLSELLEGFGLTVTVKAHPDEAAEWFARNADSVDLVITDQTMPRRTGLELARELTQRRPELPVLLHTGYSDDLRPDDVARSGIAGMLRKPFEPAAFFSLLARHLPRA